MYSDVLDDNFGQRSLFFPHGRFFDHVQHIQSVDNLQPKHSAKRAEAGSTGG